MLVTANNYIDKLKKFAETVQIEFTDYQKTCVFNAIRAINPIIESSNYTWNDFSVDNIVTVLEQTAFLNLNPSATPRECYYIVRKNWDKKEKKWLSPTLEFGVEGAGNDIILRNFGQDVADLKSYIVYQGDEFTPGYVDGWDVFLPKYKRTFQTNIPEKVVYLIKKRNGEIDAQYADTEDVKKSLLANASQNGADDKLLRQLSKEKLYDLLSNEKWLDYKISKTYNNNTYETPLFNPSYTSPISQFNMIERKLRNHATRKYPKNFNNKEIAALYEETFDEKYKDNELITAEEKLRITTKENDDNSGKEKIVVNDDRPKLVVAVEKEETPKNEIVEEVEVVIKEEEVKEEKIVKVAEENGDDDDWTN